MVYNRKTLKNSIDVFIERAFSPMKKSSGFKIFIGLLILFSVNAAVAAGGGFVSVRSKNFRFVGEAGEESLRREALRLEQFREALRRAFPDLKVDAPLSPTVLVFKDAESFAPFKPVREDGAADRSVSGFFQSSDEANYIALAAENGLKGSSGTLFHEYVHFLLKNNFQTSELPVWINEGLAEYYQTFRIKNSRRAVFGAAQKNHLSVLRRYDPAPLKTLTTVDQRSLARMTTAEKNLFYAQSWALVHYLIRKIQKDGGSINSAIEKYLVLTAAGETPEKAFETVFQTTYEQAEKELEKYISKNNFEAASFDLGENPDLETQFETEPLGEAEWLQYLGDLLFQGQRYEEAARIFRRALALDEKSAEANLLLGKTLLKQGKTDEAAVYFERAVALDGENYAANYYLADILFRKDLTPEGYLNAIPAEKAEKIRALLKKVVTQNPRLIEAYKMLALISLVNDIGVDESIVYLEKALRLDPRNFRLEYDLARLYLRRKDFEKARNIAAGLEKNCVEKDFCERLGAFLDVLDSIERKEKELAELRKRYNLENVDFDAEKLLPPEEAMNRALNRSLRRPLENEKRLVGRLKEIRCGRVITFEVEGENRTLYLSKPSFDGITLTSYSSNTAGMRIECGRPKTEMFVVATYRENPEKRTGSDGELFVLEFVPKEFRLIE